MKDMRATGVRPGERLSGALRGARIRWPMARIAQAAKRSWLADRLVVSGFAIAACYFLVGLGHIGLLDDNEGLYAQIARTMARGGSWIIPQVNGVPYIEKPPLLYYLVAAFFRTFGEFAWSARLVSALAAMSTLGVVGWFARRSFGKQASGYAVLILASSAGFVIMARQVMPDMLLTSLFAGALLVAYVALRQGKRMLMRLALALLALGTLTKGLLVPVLFFLVFALFVAGRRRDTLAPTMRILADPYGWLVFVLIAAPWHALAAAANSQFAWFYFINEHVLRFLGQRQPHDYYSGPAWYYVPRLLLALFPWTAHYALLCWPQAATPDNERDARMFLWIAVLVPLAFFSLAQAKANYYMLIVMPPLALLMGARLQELAPTGDQRRLTIPIVVVLASLAALAFAGRHWVEQWASTERIVSPYPIWPFITASLVLGGVAASLSQRRNSRLAMVLFGCMGAPLLVLLLITASAREDEISSRRLALEIERRFPDADVFLFQDFERMSSLGYYLPRPLHIIDSRSSDLAFGQRSGANPSVFVSSSELLKHTSSTPAVVLVDRSRRLAFARSGLVAQATMVAHIGRVDAYLERPLRHSELNRSELSSSRR